MNPRVTRTGINLKLIGQGCDIQKFNNYDCPTTFSLLQRAVVQIQAKPIRSQAWMAAHDETMILKRAIITAAIEKYMV